MAYDFSTNCLHTLQIKNLRGLTKSSILGAIGSSYAITQQLVVLVAEIIKALL